MIDPADFEPHLLGPYFLLELLARGDMAHVFRARTMGAAGFQREVVLKRVLPALAGNPEFLEMLVHEAKLTSSLQHGNIAQVFELGLADGELYIAMEYLEGATYREFLRTVRTAGQTLSIAEVCYTVAEACNGLDYAHRKTDPEGTSQGIVHCDLSPDNLLLSYEGVVKVVDFGLARVAARFGGPGSGRSAGAYAAPEQIEGGAIDARADVYACGTLLYEGLAGVPPFPAGSDRRKPPTSLHRIDAEVPEKLDAVVQKALAYDPDGRQPSCRHLATELTQFVGESALAGMALGRTLRTHFARRIEQRRAARVRDEVVVAELQRRLATGAVTGTSPRLPKVELPAHTPARPARRWPALVLGLCVGITLGTMGALVAFSRRPGLAVVVADVPGARVRVDRAIEGKAPLVIRNLKPYVPRLVEVEAPGRRAFTQTFAPQPGSLTVIEATLEGQTGSIRVETEPPGARLLVDGVAVGTTPVTVDRLIVGAPHRFRLELPGSAPQEFTQSIEHTENEPLRIALPPPSVAPP